MTDIPDNEAVVMGHNAQAMLRKVVADFENIQADIDAARADQKEVLVRAKADGLDVKIIRKAIRERKRTADQRDEERALLDLYLSVL